MLSGQLLNMFLVCHLYFYILFQPCYGALLMPCSFLLQPLNLYAFNSLFWQTFKRFALLAKGLCVHACMLVLVCSCALPHFQQWVLVPSSWGLLCHTLLKLARKRNTSIKVSSGLLTKYCSHYYFYMSYAAGAVVFRFAPCSVSSVSVCSMSPVCPRHHQSLTNPPEQKRGFCVCVWMSERVPCTVTQERHCLGLDTES